MPHYHHAGDSGDVDRYVYVRPIDSGLLLTHRYVHEKWHTRGRMYNVGVDINGLTPVSESVIADGIRPCDARGAKLAP